MATSVPPWAMNLVSMLPASAQEQLQVLVLKAMADPYFLPMATIPAAWILLLLPHFAALVPKVGNAGLLGYNNDTPRTEDHSKAPGGKFIVRCAGAHYNQLEMLPLFAAAVLACRIKEVNPAEMMEMSTRYLKLCAMYTLLYMFGVNPLINSARTVVWGLRIQACFAMFLA